jgi:hypothetical protein
LGYGLYTSINNEEILEGEWVDNNLNGVGKEIWSDTSYYLGEFKEHIKEGIGTYRWSDGTVYKGEFKNNQMNGVGVIKYIDDSVYEGEISNGVMNGFGKFIWKESNNNYKCYFGYYKNGKKDGFGIYYFSIKPVFNVFIGFWSNGKESGVGIRIKNKNVFYVKYREGFKEKNIKSGYLCLKYLKGDKNKYKKIFEMSHEKIVCFVNKLINE